MEGGRKGRREGGRLLALRTYDGLIVKLRAEKSSRPVSNSEVGQPGLDVVRFTLAFKPLIHKSCTTQTNTDAIVTPSSL